LKPAAQEQDQLPRETTKIRKKPFLDDFHQCSNLTTEESGTEEK
jgi:hypothetical protein